MNDKIALTMIVKGTGKEPKRLERALKTVAPYVDGIYITLTGPADRLEVVENVCKRFNAKVSYYYDRFTPDDEAIAWLKDYLGYTPFMKKDQPIFEFDKARNYNMSQVPKDEYGWILWMDTDDIFRNGQKLPKLVKYANEKNIDAYYFNYLYQVDLNDDGTIKNIVIEHLRERLLRNNGLYKWIAPIHETLIEQVPTNKTDYDGCDIVHMSDDEDRFESLNRNLPTLELSIYRTKGEDPRHIYYLAKALFDISMAMNKPEYGDHVIKLIDKYLYGEHMSGWPEERAQANEYLAEIYRNREEYDKAIKVLMDALVESPYDPSLYVALAQNYLSKNDYQRSLFWLKLAAKVPEQKTTLVKNPRDIQARTLEVLYNASLNMGKIDEAWAASVKMMELMPDNPRVKSAHQFMEQLKTQRDITRKYLEVAEHLKQSGEYAKLKPLLAAAPRIAEETPFVQDLRMKNLPPKEWDKKEIAIYCGPGFTPWSPKTLDNPGKSFVGGSEEAVINISRELQKLGWQVTVYADPVDDEGEHDGVQWLPYYKFNTRDLFNILIVWRTIGFFDQNVNAKQTYLWSHDIQNPLEWTKERIEKLTKAFFLSKWHRSNVPDLPDDKVFITTNGI